MKPRPFLGAGRRFPAYRTLGATGAAVALVVVIALAVAAGRPWSELAVIALATPLSFLLAVKISVVIFGHERIVFYEKTLFVLGADALALHLAGHPPGRGLDLAAIAIGIFLVFGRFGCFMVACCYGRPSRVGVRYGDAHARLGFPRWLVGTRLFPLQLVDAAVSAVAVGAALLAWWAPVAPGHAAAVYLAVYGPGRFVEELFRYDAVRPRWGGASEAQWTAAAIAGGLVAVVGPAWWTVAPALAMTAGLVALRARPRRLTDAWHVAELAVALRELEAHQKRTVTTSLGVQASFARIETPAGPLRDFILSMPGGGLDQPTAAALAAACGLAGATVRPGATAGLFHVLLSAPGRSTPGT